VSEERRDYDSQFLTQGERNKNVRSRLGESSSRGLGTKIMEDGELNFLRTVFSRRWKELARHAKIEGLRPIPEGGSLGNMSCGEQKILAAKERASGFQKHEKSKHPSYT